MSGEQILVEVPGATEIIEIAAQGPAGPQGPPGSSGDTYAAAVALGGHRVVALDSAGEAEYASATQVADQLRVAGVTTNAADAGDPVTVQRAGLMVDAGWAWVAGTPVLLGLDGHLVQALPPGALWLQTIGLALSPTRVLLDLQPPILLAP